MRGKGMGEEREGWGKNKERVGNGKRGQGRGGGLPSVSQLQNCHCTTGFCHSSELGVVITRQKDDLFSHRPANGDRLSSVLVNSAAKKFGCYPLDGVTRSGPPLPPTFPLPLMTPLGRNTLSQGMHRLELHRKDAL